VSAKIQEYEVDNEMDVGLWSLYQEDFESFDTDKFKRVSTKQLKELYHLLRQRGVYAYPKEKRYTYAHLLASVVQEEEFHTWTQEEVDEVYIETNGDVKSNRLKIYTKHGVGYKPSNDPRVRSGTGPVQPTIQPVQPAQPAIQPVRQSAGPPPQQPIQPPVYPQQPQQPLPQMTVQQPLLPLAQTPGYGKELAVAAKLYTDDQKYDGTSGNLDYKLSIFNDICNRADVPPAAHMKALPLMLTGIALNHYYNAQLALLTFDDACKSLRNFFEGPGTERRTLDEWNGLTLKSIVQDNSNTDKSTIACLQLLIAKLTQLQHGLTPGLRTNEFLHQKLVMACQGVPACRYAVSEPPDKLGPLINKLQSSIAAYEKENEVTDATQIYFTDRRYYRQNRYGNRRTRQDQNQLQGRCYICKRSDCRSWKHTQEEQEQSKAKFRARNQGKFNNKASDFNK
jgi:hypothetical protein